MQNFLGFKIGRRGNILCGNKRAQFPQKFRRANADKIRLPFPEKPRAKYSAGVAEPARKRKLRRRLKQRSTDRKSVV